MWISTISAEVEDEGKTREPSLSGYHVDLSIASFTNKIFRKIEGSYDFSWSRGKGL